jgi:hypothetical protein
MALAIFYAPTSQAERHKRVLTPAEILNEPAQVAAMAEFNAVRTPPLWPAI